MLEALDPASSKPARPFVAPLDLSADALQRLEPPSNVRAYVQRLIDAGLAGDALAVIARALPVQYLTAWCCECVRASLDTAGAAAEAERAALALAEQCLREPTEESRQLCLEFAERGRHASAGAWLVTAAAWAEGSLAPPGAPPVPARAEVVAEAVVAALKLAAARSGAGMPVRLGAFATRALAVFAGA